VLQARCGDDGGQCVAAATNFRLSSPRPSSNQLSQRTGAARRDRGCPTSDADAVRLITHLRPPLRTDAGPGETSVRSRF